MFQKLHQIPGLQTEYSGETINVENKKQLRCCIRQADVESTEMIFSDLGEKALKIQFKNNDFLIITSKDFILKIRQTGLFNIQNMPDAASLSEILDLARDYLLNPEPIPNDIDQSTAKYLCIKNLLENAENYNFDVRKLKEAVRNTAANTHAIGDITLYD